MNNITSSKTQKTYKRILAIKSALKYHRGNINLLNSYELNRKKIPTANKKYRLVNFNPITSNEKIRLMTLKNLKDQVVSLEIELATLIEYGA